MVHTVSDSHWTCLITHTIQNFISHVRFPLSRVHTVLVFFPADSWKYGHYRILYLLSFPLSVIHTVLISPANTWKHGYYWILCNLLFPISSLHAVPIFLMDTRKDGLYRILHLLSFTPFLVHNVPISPDWKQGHHRILCIQAVLFIRGTYCLSYPCHIAENTDTTESYIFCRFHYRWS